MKNIKSVKYLNLILGAIFTTNTINAEVIHLSGRIILNDDSTTIATIELIDNLSQLKETTFTNPENGYFKFDSLLAGHSYKLVCSSMGYNTDTLKIEAASDSVQIGDISLNPDPQAIKEVVVTADMVETFASKDKIFIPLQIKNFATSGYDAIRQLPQFAENIAMEKLITPDRRTLKILINGIESTEKDLKILPAKEVQRIEYFSNPPARYANLGIGAVINVITLASRTSGSDYLIDTKNAVTTGSGSDSFSAKFYNNNNQLDFNYSLNYRNLDGNLINQDYSYEIDGTQYQNQYRGIDGIYKGEMHSAQLGYLYNVKDNILVSAKLNSRFNPGKEKNRQSSLVSVDGQPDIAGITQKYLRSNNSSYSGDFYLSKQLKNDQEIVANFVATRYSSSSVNHLLRDMSDSDLNFDYQNETKNKTWSVIGELLYNKKFGNHELTNGFRFFNKELRQTYNQGIHSKITQQIYYVYSGLTGKLSKLAYALELGLESSHNRLAAIDKFKTDYVSFNPTITLSYPVSKKSSLKFATRTYGSIPEISMLTLDPVYLNYNYVSIGNPNLKPYYILQSELKYQLSGSNIFLNTGFNYNHSFNPFVASFVKESDQILKTWAYKDYRSFIGYTMSMRWSPWKWMALQTFFALGYTEIGNKDGSHLTDFTKLASFSLSIMHKKFRLLTQMQTVFSNLYGDYLEKTGAALTSELTYTHKSLTLGVQYIKNTNPLQLISKNPVMRLKEETIWSDYRNLVMLKASYRFSLGKKNAIRVNQRIKNSDEDSGLREDAKAK